MDNIYQRRSFIKKSLAGMGGVILAPNFISCNKNSDTAPAVSIPNNLNTSNFDHGVASFDPSQDQVIIWTRYTSNAASVALVWELATDIDFSNIIRSEEVVTDASRDYTVAIEILSLEPNQKLYYRFANIDDKTVSVIGETLTLPIGNVDQIKLGVASCANYAAGLFNVYKQMANSNIDIVVHLGDYIYEYADGQYGTNSLTASLGRNHKPENEILSVADYRTRYKQYRSDEDLQLLHQKKPFICVWDDHEIANDAYKSGAQNHQSDEGDFDTRKQYALQVYSEYLPFKNSDNSIIYRSFKIGNLADLIMLDTRVVGRDKQLNYSDYFDATGTIDNAAFQTDWLNPERTILGATQRNWLLNEISGSTAEFQILGQQVLMGKMFVPLEILVTFNVMVAELTQTGSLSDATLTTYQQLVADLVLIKLRSLSNDPTLSEAELARLSAVPYNLDAWDGYPIEREVVLEACQGKKVAVLSGDTHNAWQNSITSNSGSSTVSEFATSSVASPGFESAFGGDVSLSSGFEQALTLLIDGLNYMDASKRGFMEITITPGNIASQWVFIDTVFSKTFNTSLSQTLTLS